MGIELGSPQLGHFAPGVGGSLGGTSSSVEVTGDVMSDCCFVAFEILADRASCGSGAVTGMLAIFASA